jgi:hypothetical protein
MRSLIGWPALSRSGTAIDSDSEARPAANCRVAAGLARQ